MKIVKKYYINILQFLGVFLVSSTVIYELPNYQKNIFDLSILCFLLALYFVSIYEIPIKHGIYNSFTNKRIALEVIIVWVFPLLLGYLVIIYFES
jgi:hypothetical protein